jgi:voltage-gated potassium channel
MEQKRVHEILEPARAGDLESKIFDVALIALIVFGAVVAIFATVEDIAARYGNLIWALEALLVLIFAQEYALRVWACTAEQRYEHPFWGRIRWVTSPMGLVDLMAFLPWYVFLLFPGTGLAQLALLFRLLRLFKLFRYSESLQTLAMAMRRKREELTVVLVAVLVLIVLVSSLMYMVERRAQPEVFSSVPAAMWWGVVTLTTVGYGDIYPVTVAGRLLAGVMALLGIGFIALPAGILASGFAEEIRKRHRNTQVCPHCG